MKTLFTLTAAEAKRFLARGFIRLEEFRRSFETARVIVANGTTNAYIVEELTGETLAREKYTAGVITRGRLCATSGEDRHPPYVFEQGQAVDKNWEQVLDEFTAADVFVKGANAVDLEGNAGVLIGDPCGGTIGRALHIIEARGATLYCPVGLEKLVPSVNDAARILGIETLEKSMGMPVGMIPVTTAEVITEEVLIERLFGVQAVHVTSGGTGGSEGAVTIAVQGEREAVEDLLQLITAIKGEKPLPAWKKGCKGCDTNCTYSK